MTLKKIKIINVVFLFLLSFLWHFMYNWFPNNIFALVFPVNESIWEHMKIIYYCLLLGSVLKFYLCKKNNIKINNFYIEAMVKSLLGVIFYLIIFIPLYLWLGESMIISIGLMLVTYIFMEFIGYKILTSEELNINILPVIIIALGCIMFVILTFYPLHNFLFFDEVKFGYGILK
ncbi:MAG: hypothetical protein KIC90_03515 [Firmicutes bacterium]|nr:hypothetical protein [Bacillota bacterium]